MYGMLRCNIEKVDFYSYRSANIVDVIMRLDRESEDGQEIENMLWNISGATRCNHAVFNVTTKGGNNSIAYKLSDDYISIGFGIDARYW